jgi:hypothetical protein
MLSNSPVNIKDRVSRAYGTMGNNYSFMYFNLYVFRQQAGKEKILNWIVITIPRIYAAALSLFMN